MTASSALTLFLALALFGFVLLAVSPLAARAADPVIVRVTTSGTTTWPCGDQSNWSNPCALQTALSNTVSASELWVAAGTYTPTMGVTRTATFQLRDGVAPYGGFAMTETLRSERNIAANVTILSGDLNGDDSGNVHYDEATRAENAYHVVTGSGVTTTAVLDGFTVTGGNTNDPYPGNGSGGGMYNSGGSPTLANITFISNSARYGGGMYNLGGSPTLINVTFSGNSALWSAGGTFNEGSSPTLTNVTFISNSTRYGGGMYNWGSNPARTDVTFMSNTVSVYGGGMYNGNYSSPTLANVTFSSNESYHGGGMYNSGGSPTLINVTFSGNEALFGGAGMYNEGSSATYNGPQNSDTKGGPNKVVKCHHAKTLF